MTSPLPAVHDALKSAVPSSRHVRELDGIRGIAILMVIGFHFGLYRFEAHGLLHDVYRDTLELGWAGVDLFFVLSGCLITGILLDAKNSRRYFRSFYMRRVLRILPLYYVSVFAFFCIFLPVARTAAPGWVSHQDWMRVEPGQAIWYWLHLSNWRSGFDDLQLPISHFWSLAIEEQFYLVWPLVVFYVSEGRLFKLCVVLIFLAAALRNLPVFEAQAAHYPEFLYRITPFRVEPLALGAMIAILARRASFLRWTRRWLWLPCSMGAAVLLMIMVAANSGIYRNERMSRFGFTAIGLICFSMVAYGLMHAGSSSALARLLRLPPLVSFGKYSYGMYVLHVPVAFFWPAWLRQTLPHAGVIAGSLISLVSGILISYLLALASWHLIESRFLRLKDRFAYQAGEAGTITAQRGPDQQAPGRGILIQE
jgi:peptidoglycan/LPS O-acetylase OafA/YrhL